MENRTVRDFVEDHLSNKIPAKQILMMAKNTRWKSEIEEIEEIFRNFPKKFKKRFQIINKNDDNIGNRE